MPNSGNIIVTERDVNPFSSTFNTTRTRTYQDYERCEPYTAPVWTVQSSTCETVDGYNTGYLVIVETDTNQYSSTYNTTRTRYELDLTECQITSGFKVIKIYGVEHNSVAMKTCNNYILVWEDITPLYNSNGNGIAYLIIGDCVTQIYSRAINSLDIRYVYVPSTVTYIGSDAFWDCERLDNVVLPSVVTIESGAFRECDSLHNIDLGDRLVTLGNRVFKDSFVLNNVVLPNTVTTIGDEVFSGCSGLTTLTCLATTPPTLGSHPFGTSNSGNINIPNIYVPAESVNAYKTAWNTYASHIQALPT